MQQKSKPLQTVASVGLPDARNKEVTFMNEECLQTIEEGRAKKGDVLTVAQVAGVMGAKKTSDLIPSIVLYFIISVPLC